MFKAGDLVVLQSFFNFIGIKDGDIGLILSWSSDKRQYQVLFGEQVYSCFHGELIPLGVK